MRAGTFAHTSALAFSMAFAAPMLLTATPSQAQTCEGSTCRPGVKAPLDLTKFTRGNARPGVAVKPQAAAKTKTKPRTRMHAKVESASVSRPARQAAPKSVAHPMHPARQPSEWPASVSAYAPDADSGVQVVSGDALNVIDLAAGRSPPETSGAGVREETGVKLVAADEFNAIDRPARVAIAKSAGPDTSAAARAAEDTATPGSENGWWMDRVWSKAGQGFVALFDLFR